MTYLCRVGCQLTNHPTDDEFVTDRLHLRSALGYAIPTQPNPTRWCTQSMMDISEEIVDFYEDLSVNNLLMLPVKLTANDWMVVTFLTANAKIQLTL